MITIVPLAQSLACRFEREMVAEGQFMNALGEIGGHLVFRDAANSVVAPVHRYVGEAIEVGENANLPKLCHAGEERELEVTIARLHHTVEGFQDDAIVILQLFIANGREHGLVVFVNE